MTSIIRVSALVLAFMSFSPANASTCGPAGQAPDQYILRLDLRASLSNSVSVKAVGALDAVIANSDGRSSWVRSPNSDTLRAASFDRASTPSILATHLSAETRDLLVSDPRVLSVEPDCFVKVSSLPNDTQLPNNAWATRALNLEAAWNDVREASSVIVSISDTGIDFTHEDLRDNMWTNTAELNGRPLIDDDENGCIDDLHGCDLADGDGDPSPGALSSGTHGTHVAGITGAVGNNARGISGVAWKTQVMAAKGFSNYSDSAKSSDLLRTIYYSVDSGARIINCSWGIARSPSTVEIQAFRYALSKNVLPVVAAGNEGDDASWSSPAAIPGVLTVGSIGSRDVVSAFSNFGDVVSVFAPGGDSLSRGGLADEFIFSTIPTARGSYGNLRGTSMAAPYVSGLAALILAVRPELFAQDVASVIKASSRSVTSRLPNGRSSSVSIPDAATALQLARTFTPSATPLPSCDQAPENCAASKPRGSQDFSSVEEPSSGGGGCGLVTASSGGPPTSPPTLLLAILFLLPLAAAVRLRRAI